MRYIRSLAHFIGRLVRIHRIFVAQEIKRMVEYKADFFIGMIGFLMVQCSNLLMLWIIFNSIPTLMGWSLPEVVFIYGFSLIPKGLDHLLYDNLWMVGSTIVSKGEFDKYLTLPINTLAHVLFEKLQVDAIGELVMGIALICSVLPQISVEWSFGKILLGLVSMFFSTYIFTGVKTLTASVSFWRKRSSNIITLGYKFANFTKYPATIYNEFIKNLITYIIPFAFTSYYPSVYILTGDNPLFNVGVTVLVSVLVMGSGVIVWHLGLRAYESAGS